MNAQTPAPTPPPVPMVKETIVKDDGRFLSYYSFPDDAPRPTVTGEKDPEAADV